MLKIVVLATALSAVLSGCSSWGPYNTMPRVDDIDLKKRGKTQLDVTIETAKYRMNGWYDVLKDTQGNKEVWDIATKELFFYGSVAFSLASAQLLKEGSDMWKKVRNAGAGTAFGANLVSGHYQLEAQRTAFRDAAARAKCGAFAIANINLEDERLALIDSNDVAQINIKLSAADSSSPGFLALYNRIPLAANDYIEKVILRKLESELKSAAPTKPTLSDISASMDKWKKDQDVGAAASFAPSSRIQLAGTSAARGIVLWGNLDPAVVPNSLKGKTPLQLELMRANFINAVVTFESQLKACEIAS